MNHSLLQLSKKPFGISGGSAVGGISPVGSSSRGYLASLIVLMLPFLATSIFAQSETSPDSDGYEYTAFESYISASLNAPSGTSELSYGTSVQLDLSVTRLGRELWIHPTSGDTRIKNELSESVDSGQYYAQILQGDGYLSSYSGYTDGSGIANFSYLMGNSDATVEVIIQDFNGYVTSTSISLGAVPPPPEQGEPMPEPETWNFSHSEGLLYATLTASGSTESVSAGAATPITAQVSYESWDVEWSSYGNSRTTNHVVSAACGATVQWTVVEGTGTVEGSSWTAQDGTAFGTFWMNDSDAVVKVHVSYGFSSTAEATLAFSAAPPTPTGSYFTRFRYSINFDPFSSEAFAEGNNGTATGTLSYVQEEIWTEPGGVEHLLNTPEPIAGASMSVSLDSAGDLVLQDTSVTTDAAGHFSVNFIVGAQSSAILASPAFAPSVQDTIYVIPIHAPPPETPILLRSEGGYYVNHTGPFEVVVGEVCGISGQLRWWGYDVMTDGVTEWNENHVDDAVTDLDLIVTAGSGVLSGSPVTTDSEGNFYVEFSSSVANTEVVLSGSLGGSTNPLFSTTVKVVPVPETWENVGSPYPKLLLTAEADLNTGEPDSQSTITVGLVEEYWTQQLSNYGHTREVNLVDNETYFSTPLDGAPIQLSVSGQNGGSVDNQIITSGGIATANYTFGTGAAEVLVSVMDTQVPIQKVLYFQPTDEIFTLSGSFTVRKLTGYAPRYEGVPNEVLEFTFSMIDEVWNEYEGNRGSSYTQRALDPDSVPISLPVEGESIRIVTTADRRSSGTDGTDGSEEPSGPYTYPEVSTVLYGTGSDGTISSSLALGVNGGQATAIVEDKVFTLTFSLVEETWTPITSRSTSVNIERVEGPWKPNLRDTVVLRAAVRYSSSVSYNSNYGNWQGGSSSSGPAENAPVTWSLLPQAGATTLATIQPLGQTKTTSDGYAYATFTMGSLSGVEVRATTDFNATDAFGTAMIHHGDQFVGYERWNKLVVSIVPESSLPKGIAVQPRLETWQRFRRGVEDKIVFMEDTAADAAEVVLTTLSGNAILRTPSGTVAAGVNEHRSRIAASTESRLKATVTHGLLTETAEYIVSADVGDLDPDEDGLSNSRELAEGTDPWSIDTDGDGFSDWEELDQGNDPLSASSNAMLLGLQVFNPLTKVVY